MPDSHPSTLLLVPTPLEFEQLVPKLNSMAQEREAILEVCGFGVVAAAARTMQLIARHNPRQVLLVGIAGALNDDLPIGTAASFRRVVCDGIGVGQRSNFESADLMGWKQWMPVAQSPNEVSDPIGDHIDLQTNTHDAAEVSKELVTVCAASADAHEAEMRRERHPSASAEDMEGFGVAMACKLAGVPLQIVRGISNRAGDRDKLNWDIESALQSARDLAIKILSS